jgi:hypothetical protein
MGMKARPVTGIASTAFRKEKWQYACGLFRTNSFKEGAM